MEKANINVLGFKKDYPSININLKENDTEKYDLCIVQIYLSELNLGYVVDKIYKTSNKGTKVSYKSYDKETIRKYIDKVNRLIDDFNIKYNKNLKHIEITFK